MSKLPNDFGSLRRHLWALPFTVVMLCTALLSWRAGDTRHAGMAFFLVVSSSLPLLIERIWRVRLPAFMQCAYVAFLFVSMFSGEVLGMYGRFYPWDDIVHFLSGLFVGTGTLLWLVSVIDRAQLQLPAWLQTVYITAIGGTVAVLWEIVEFSSDRLFGTWTQRNDLFDTMTDLIFGTLGSLVVAYLLHQALRHRPNLGVGRMIAYYQRLNRR